MNDRCLFESEGRAENGEPFMRMHKTYGGFYYATRAGHDSVAFILKHKNGMIGLLRCLHEPLAKWDVRAFTGSLDVPPGVSAYEVVVEEAREESGYRVTYKELEAVGTYEVGHMTDERVLLYVIHVDDSMAGKPTTQDPSEQRFEVVWDWGAKHQTSDWKAILAMEHLWRKERQGMVLCERVDGQHGWGYRPVDGNE